jgi:hypothetical protein
MGLFKKDIFNFIFIFCCIQLRKIVKNIKLNNNELRAKENNDKNFKAKK